MNLRLILVEVEEKTRERNEHTYCIQEWIARILHIELVKLTSLITFEFAFVV
jgi:hypothetical protein